MKNTKLGISLYRIFSRAYFYLPFLTIFFYMQGYSIVYISVLMAVYGASSFVFSLLLKQRITERVTMKNVLILSEIIKFTGLSFLCLFNGLYAYIIAQVFLGVSYSLGSGIDSKIIYTEIIDNPVDFQSKTNSYMFNTLLVSGLIGSWLFELNIYYPIIMTAIFTFLGIIIISLTLPNSYIIEETTSLSEIKYKTSAREKKLIVSYAFLRGVILTLFTTFLPYYFFIDFKIPTYYFILILTSYTLIGSYVSKKISINNNPRITLKLSLLLLIIALTSYSIPNIYLIVFATILLGASSGVIRPTVSNALKKEGKVIENLDIAEKIYSVINVLFILIGGVIYHESGFTNVLLLAGIILIIYIVFIKIIDINEKRKNNEN